MVDEIGYSPEKVSQLVMSALDELVVAESQLYSPTTPATPVIRHKIFTWWPGITWPYKDKDTVFSGNVHYTDASKKALRLEYKTASDRSRVADTLLRLCEHQPRHIVHVIQKIRATSAWCVARHNGRVRAAKEILRQQQAALKKLQDMMAMKALGGLSKI